MVLLNNWHWSINCFLFINLTSSNNMGVNELPSVAEPSLSYHIRVGPNILHNLVIALNTSVFMCQAIKHRQLCSTIQCSSTNFSDRLRDRNVKAEFRAGWSDVIFVFDGGDASAKGDEHTVLRAAHWLRQAVLKVVVKYACHSRWCWCWCCAWRV